MSPCPSHWGHLIQVAKHWVGECNGTPLQYSCLENPIDGGAWYAAIHGVAKSQTRLSDFTFTFHFHALEKEMATHSSVLAWRISGMGEPGGLPSVGVAQSWTQPKRLSSSSSSIPTIVRNLLKQGKLRRVATCQGVFQGSGLPGFMFQLLWLSGHVAWASYFTSLGINSFICEVRMKILTSQSSRDK